MAKQIEMFDERSRRFYEANKWIVDVVAQRAKQLIAEDYEYWSIYGLIHEIRFSCRKRIVDPDAESQPVLSPEVEVVNGQDVVVPEGPKAKKIRINNNVIPYIARKVHQKYPELKSFFKIRKRKYAEEIGKAQAA